MQLKYLIALVILGTSNTVLHSQPNDSIQAFWEDLGVGQTIDYIEVDFGYTPVDGEKYGILTRKSDKPYETIKTNIGADRQSLQKLYNSGEITLDSVSGYFTNRLINQVIPYWYGTPWDFDGYTNEPNEGTIACGYFISTTLKHMGINWNRYRLAQQAALLELMTVAGPGEIHALPETDPKDFIKYVKENLEEGLYLLGLTSHVGFIYYVDGEVFFIHSNFVFPSEVVIEYANVSNAILYSFDYYLTSISGNKYLLEKWLSGEEVKVITQ